MTLRLAQVAEVRLGRQRAPQYEDGDHLIPYLRSANVVDGGLDLTDVKSMNFDPVEQAIFGLADGDVLMTEGSGSAETVGTSAVWRNDLPGTVCFQNTLLRLRSRSGVTDGRFIAWWARHAHASGQIAAVSSGANIQHIGSDGLKDLRIHVPELGEQRRIADFLDDRVARIDQIIAARQRQISLLADHAHAEIDRFIESRDSERLTRLARFAVVQSGITVDAGRATEGLRPRPYLSVANVQAGYLDLSAVKEVFVSDALASRATLRAGDVLMTEGGDLDKLGRGTLWAGELSNCLHQNHVFAVRSVSSALSPEFLAMYSRTSAARKYFESTGVRSTNLASTSAAKVRDLPIPVRDPRQQEQDTRAAQAAVSWQLAGQDRLEAQMQVLQEYKQSLITAAVTGEIDVTTAGSGGPRHLPTS